MTATSPATNLDNTNQAILAALHFLSENSIITIFHLIVLFGAAWAIWKIGRLHSEAEKTATLCKPIILAMFAETKKGLKQFSVAFFIGFVMFCISLAFDRHGGVPSMMVQIMTYAPTMALALSQAWSIRNSLSTLSKFI